MDFEERGTKSLRYFPHDLARLSLMPEGFAVSSFIQNEDWAEF